MIWAGQSEIGRARAGGGAAVQPMRGSEIMGFVKANGIVLHHALEGDETAPVLVFSNSLGTDFRIWDQVVVRLGDGFRLIRYDSRGHGLSESPAGPYAIEDNVADLVALLDHVGVSSAVVAGLSVGGMIAQGLSAARPELVQGLVLCDTAHRIGPLEMWNDRMAAIRQDGIEALADPILERWFSKAFRRERPAELAGWRAMLTRTPVEGYLGTCAAIRDGDLSDAARAITVPCLCVVGSEDGATPPALVRSLADLIPGARFEVVQGVGHLPCIEVPDLLAELIINFVRQGELV
jgi:3-oxoadipate enol-lactonase